MESIFTIIGLLAVNVIVATVLYHLHMRQHGFSSGTAQHVKYHM